MDSELELLRQTFLTEAEEGLAAMEEALVTLEAFPDDPEPLHAIFRTIHTIKGSAAIVGFNNVSELAHLVEDALEAYRSGMVRVTPVHVSLLLLTVDALREVIAAAAAGRTELRARDRRLVGFLAARSQDAPAPADPAAHRSGSVLVSDGLSRTRTLRIRLERLDQMVDLVGEAAIARGRLNQMLEEQRSVVGDGILMAAAELDRLVAELQAHVLRVRMVPIGPLFRQYLRTVRDVAASLGKRARLVIEGEDVELDTSVLDHLRDPLTHMVRNAIDHGIEPPAERAAKGKDPIGRITLRARHEGGMIVVDLADDGAGLDRARLLEHARARGLVGPTESPPDRDLVRLIFEPGFSTADGVTELSGRGVGLDVVRRNVEALRGSVSVESVEGAGTTITLRLPLTLAIVSAFAVGVAGETYLIPLDAVAECLALPSDTLLDAGGRGVINLRGEVLPCVRLATLLSTWNGPTSTPSAIATATPEESPRRAAGREHVVVVRHGGLRAGFVVDALLGGLEVVIKPLEGLLTGLPGVAGATILGSGRAALVLDVAAVLDTAITSEAAVGAVA
jgi:two-component system chemotaxis sensor kinase CheA